jgi:hypothetical protein
MLPFMLIKINSCILFKRLLHMLKLHSIFIEKTRQILVGIILAKDCYFSGQESICVSQTIILFYFTINSFIQLNIMLMASYR